MGGTSDNSCFYYYYYYYNHLNIQKGMPLIKESRDFDELKNEWTIWTEATGGKWRKNYLKNETVLLLERTNEAARLNSKRN